MSRMPQRMLAFIESCLLMLRFIVEWQVFAKTLFGGPSVHYYRHHFGRMTYRNYPYTFFTEE